ncbi:hypothetical protein TcasGA2_TC015611 [Tribolium castaneum]|uniref:Uncharacterized protein n=1 Tax=Tribolium castaneum TaxID=7070 RepID=D2A5X6_TRICA|nr:hypothetical protein TcasGA2_TC015611 [Tribolium castaneum]
MARDWPDSNMPHVRVYIWLPNRARPLRPLIRILDQSDGVLRASRKMIDKRVFWSLVRHAAYQRLFSANVITRVPIARLSIRYLDNFCNFDSVVSMAFAGLS